MFAYGTTLLVIFHWDQGAGALLLALPIVCALCSIGVAMHALQRTGVLWPKHILDRFSFFLDVVLTIAYVAVWILLAQGLIGEGAKNIATIVILLCWNVGIFTSFFPLLRQVYQHPETERTAPWAIWALAYGVLVVATAIEKGALSALILYPLVNALVHGFIAIRTAFWNRRSWVSA